MLGPIEKYRKKGIFPFKFVSHILLIFLTCAEILYLVNSQIEYSYNSIRTFQNMFMQG
jgi:hypothetical protein